MISYLKGKIIYRDLKSVVVDVSGIGYKVFTSSQQLDSQIDHQNEIELFTYLAVRENALDLYGFSTKQELDFFELLLTVSGIGPKSAMTILSVASLQTLRQAIATNDSSHLIKVSGVGKKNADKIVLELKDKLHDFVADGTLHLEDTDALEALRSLGYSEKESREALKKTTSKDTESKIKEALKNIK